MVLTYGASEFWFMAQVEMSWGNFAGKLVGKSSVAPDEHGVA